MASNHQAPSSSKYEQPKILPAAALSETLPLSPNKSERLSSIRGPRDLTLGGAMRRQKTRVDPVTNRTYVPNLNVTRNKNLDVKVASPGREDGRSRGGRGGRGGNKNDRGRGGSGNKRGTTMVQTFGIFSEGAGDSTARRRAQASARYSNSSSDRHETIQRPTFIKNSTKYDPDYELQQMKEILGDDDNEEVINNPKSREENLPILLAKTFKSWNLSNKPVKVKTENVGNNKHLDDNVDKILSAPEIVTPADDILKLGFRNTLGIDENFYPKNLDELFERRKSQFILLQLPDCLPNANIKKEDVGDETEKKETVKEEPVEKPPPLPQSITETINEGRIGKILKYKSGRVQLVLGDSKFDVELGMDAGLLQELVSINTNSEQRNGDMVNLGQIQGKLNVIPDWEDLFIEAEIAGKKLSPITGDT